MNTQPEHVDEVELPEIEFIEEDLENNEYDTQSTARSDYNTGRQMLDEKDKEKDGDGPQLSSLNEVARKYIHNGITSQESQIIRDHR